MKTIEVLLWIVGAALITLYVGARAWGEHERQQGVASFIEIQQDVATTLAATRLPGESLYGGPELKAAALGAQDAVIALLRIPGIALEVPVYYGTGEPVLRRGAGLVEGTAVPGSAGNVGIAAHRDSFFRGLKDVSVGDLIELSTPGQTWRYRITSLSVVDPSDVHVLDDVGEPILTLVTCYPFYFVGNAPQRYIVRAVAADVRS
jgi:sortase A